ncbi:MAG: PPOX class F420-dependent oxidoreductase [Friedmanniella sp.]
MSCQQEVVTVGRERFVSLTTFRRSGQPVATPVWVAADGDALVVITPEGTGKVKRLRHDPRVELRPCSRSGIVAPGAPVLLGQAEIVADPARTARIINLIGAKYGLEYRLVLLIERLAVRRRRPRLGLRITPCGPAER